jgi:poly(3-hydroxybutyrate) depolymerase
VTAQRPRVTRYVYRGCLDGPRVALLRLSGTDHGWRGAGPPRHAHNPSCVSAPREPLHFVVGARRP